MKDTETKKSLRKGKRRQHFLPLAIGRSGGVVIGALAFWFFAKQADRVVDGEADKLDISIIETVQRIDNPAMHRAMNAVTQLGSHAGIAAAAASTTRGR